MSGGISAIKGFDYQSTVILDLLFPFFDKYKESGQVRPEGLDDLDLQWLNGESKQRHYIQIKKPREDQYGVLKPRPWSLTEAINELFPNAIDNLNGNAHNQTWLFGDDITPSLKKVIDAGLDAPLKEPKSFWKINHFLARNDMLKAFEIEKSTRAKILRYQIPESQRNNSAIVENYSLFLKELSVNETAIDLYKQRITQLGSILPNILSRIEIESTYGTEQFVKERVHSKLQKRYGLSNQVIEKTLFRNLRGFINDISKQLDRTFTIDEFEVELRCVWPAMIPIKTPPEIGAAHIRRPDKSKQIAFLKKKAIEIIGISGSGKTMLASEVIEHFQDMASGRKVYYAEIRDDVSLRDVLTGISFHLRRSGISKPFTIAINNTSPGESILKELGNCLSNLETRVLLLADFVEGTCNYSFAREIRTFVQSLSGDSLQLALKQACF